jgi:predicted metalloprotease with PDZ domain
MIELKIGDLLDTILKEMYQEGLTTKERVISAESFRKTYKKVCGIRPREIFSNWITSTSCPKLTLNYEFNKRYNSLDLTLKQ